MAENKRGRKSKWYNSYLCSVSVRVGGEVVVKTLSEVFVFKEPMEETNQTRPFIVRYEIEDGSDVVGSLDASRHWM